MEKHPRTNITITARAGEQHFVREGEAPMSQQQQDQYKAILGDEKARVSVGRDISEKDYGNGGGVMVNVTLTCGQSQPEISQAIALAHQIADGAAWHYHGQMKQQLISGGVLK